MRKPVSRAIVPKKPATSRETAPKNEESPAKVEKTRDAMAEGEEEEKTDEDQCVDPSLRADEKKKEPSLPCAKSPAKMKRPSAKAEPRKRQKAELVSEETTKNGWKALKFKRNTSGTPFWKFVSPTNDTFWTLSAAEAAGFKRSEP